MSPTNTELQAAFNRSKLSYLGYTLQSALACDALKICLVRIATNIQKQAASAPAKQYWWKLID